MGLFQDQQVALDQISNFLQNDDKEHAIEGAAGTGKSFLMEAVLREAHRLNRTVSLCTPTHKAARVLAEATGSDCKTIHKTLGLKLKEMPDGKKSILFGEMTEPVGDLLVVDEASMVNQQLMAAIRSRAKHKILFVGDAFQLPPIEDEKKPKLDCYIPVFRQCKGQKSQLTEPKRQGKDNPILDLADELRDVISNSGQLPTPPIQNSGTSIICVNGADFREKYLQDFASDDFQEDEDYSRILSWTNRAASMHNHFVREQIYPGSKGLFQSGERLVANDSYELKLGTDTIDLVNNTICTVRYSHRDNLYGVAGQKVQVLFECERRRYQHKDCLYGSEPAYGATLITPEESKWDYWTWDEKVCTEIFIGDDLKEIRDCIAEMRTETIARRTEIQAMNPQKITEEIEEEARLLWPNFYRKKDQFVDVRPIYASTVHKSQGSTYKRAYVDLMDIQMMPQKEMLARLLYVAVTRPSETLIIRTSA